VTRALVVPTLMIGAIYVMFTSMRRHGARPLQGRQHVHARRRMTENIT
jgi:hypothetical protein